MDQWTIYFISQYMFETYLFKLAYPPQYPSYPPFDDLKFETYNFMILFWHAIDLGFP